LTEDQKQQALVWIREHAAAAERSGLQTTARSWMGFYEVVAARPAAEMMLTADKAKIILSC